MIMDQLKVQNVDCLKTILLGEDDADAPVSDIKSAADLLPHFRDLRRVVLLAQQHNLFHLQGVPPLNGYSVDQSGD